MTWFGGSLISAQGSYWLTVRPRQPMRDWVEARGCGLQWASITLASDILTVILQSPGITVLDIEIAKSIIGSRTITSMECLSLKVWNEGIKDSGEHVYRKYWQVIFIKTCFFSTVSIPWWVKLYHIRGLVQCIDADSSCWEENGEQNNNTMRWAFYQAWGCYHKNPEALSKCHLHKYTQFLTRAIQDYI